MTNLIYCLMAVAVIALAACSAGGKTTDSDAGDSIRQEVAAQPTTIASLSGDDFIGLYADPYDGSTLEICNGTDGALNVEVSIVRLTLLDDGRGNVADNALTFTATDAAGNPIQGKITLDGDTATVAFTNSTWDYLPDGTSFRFVRTARADN